MIPGTVFNIKSLSSQYRYSRHKDKTVSGPAFIYDETPCNSRYDLDIEWASYQIREIVGCACAAKPGTCSLPPRVSDPKMHYGTCMTHARWCTPESLTSSFLWSLWRGKLSRHSRRMHNSQFYVSGKRPIRAMVVSQEISRHLKE